MAFADQSVERQAANNGSRRTSTDLRETKVLTRMQFQLLET